MLSRAFLDIVRRTVFILALTCCCTGAHAWAQPPADCAPNVLNIPGAPYPCIFPDGRVMFRVAAPNAQKVKVRIGRGFEMSKGPSIDGTVVADPAFNAKVRVLFLGIGSEEGAGTKTFSEQLTQAGIHHVYFESPGTAHEWLTWPHCLREFAPRLFR
jgi:hypothetical protein